jgi:hypothetical protein
MLLTAFYQWASLIALVLSAAAGLWRGGWPERAAAFGMVGAWFVSALFQSSLQRRGVQTGVMITDILLLALLLAIALKSDRWWPMWAAAFQAMNVVVHLAVLADAKIWGWAYFTGGAVFSYLVMLSLLVGALSRPGRRKPAAT